jgi:hydroxymethylpyrimidine/phosphomethylpyrimidine kinase
MGQTDHITDRIKPCVLVIAGHDPSGGAGIQADIETLSSLGCVPLTIVSALTAQNTEKFAGLTATEPSFLARQLELLLEDFAIAACKIGLLDSAEQVPVICDALGQLKSMPVVLDPVLAATRGPGLADADLQGALLSEFSSRAHLITPNFLEAQSLLAHVLPTPGEDQYGPALNQAGFDYARITGTHAPTAKVANTLFHAGESIDRSEWERLPGEYHGSGCTLASAITAGLAHGRDMRSAVIEAQHYTWQSLKHALQLGHGQAHPNRFSTSS